jgi:hypothetical protein
MVIRARTPIKDVLTEEQESRGYRLYRYDGRIELYHLEKCVQAFPANTKPWTIIDFADKHWNGGPEQWRLNR